MGRSLPIKVPWRTSALGGIFLSKCLGELKHGGQGDPDLHVDLPHGEAYFQTIGCLLLAPTIDQLNDLLSHVLVGDLQDRPLPWGPAQTEVPGVHCLQGCPLGLGSKPLQDADPIRNPL